MSHDRRGRISDRTVRLVLAELHRRVHPEESTDVPDRHITAQARLLDTGTHQDPEQEGERPNESADAGADR